MTKKSGKKVSFDAMVKFFMQYYRIPTKGDIEKLLDRLDTLEKLIKSQKPQGRGTRAGGVKKLPPAGRKLGVFRPGVTASDIVSEVIRQGGDEGVSFGAIKDKTRFDDKKLRNIIFRLNKLGMITRKTRGVYTTSGS